MYIGLFFKGLLTGFLVSMPIGPLAVLVIQRTVNRNLKSGIFTGLGVAFTDSIWVVIAGFSISYIITFLETYQSHIQIIGAFLLFFLGINIFLSHPLKSFKEFKRKGTNPFQNFMIGVGVAFSNPLTVLAYIVLFAGTNIVFVVSDILDPISFISGFYIGAAIWWLVLTTILNLFRHRFNLHVLWWFNKISGAMIMLLVVIITIYVLINGNPKI